MPLASGSRIGPFEIGSPLGAGGMGEVYRARDTRLNRDVALKLLPDLFAGDPERLARFKREAQVLASLNHPHIGAIYGIEENASAALQALILELVEGPTLADRIAQGPMSVEEALPVARQIAEALEAAHQHGVIHRDLKPANVTLRDDGFVKVLDFGLAKLTGPGEPGPSLQPSGSAGSIRPETMLPTITTPAATGIGTILGTAAYMAPEQARGKAVDKRADVWAFGCVLYEMLTARRAFPGEDVTETIASVVKDEPDWSLLPADLSPAVRVFLRRCLAKNPADRVRDIGDVRLAIGGAFDVPATPGSTPSGRAARTRPTALAAIALALVLVTAGITWRLKPSAPERQSPLRRFAISTAPAQLAIATNNRDVAITPDGTRIVYFGGVGSSRQLYVHSLDALQGTAIRQADRFFEPFISPDARWVGFNDESDFALRKMPLGGGPPVTITRVGREILGATWGPDDTIVFATTEAGTGLWRVPAGGGKPTVLTTPDKSRGEVRHSWPEYLPGGRALLFTIQSGEQRSDFQIAALNLETGETKLLAPRGSGPRFSPSGHLVYAVENAVGAVPFDPVGLEVLGDPVVLLEGVITKSSGGGNFSVAADGTLVYVAGGAAGVQRRLVWAERGGTKRPINAPPRAYVTARLSPDGTRAALDVRDQQSDIWIWDFARETLSRLTTDPAIDSNPIWTPDGRRIVFGSQRTGPGRMFVQPADGTSAPERLTEASITRAPNSFSPDGLRLIFREDSRESGQDLRMLVLDNERRDLPLVQTGFNERNGEISPNGWLAYESNESGRFEVYVRPFPDTESGRWQISANGGFFPAWASNGRELFYVAADGRLMAVDIRTRPAFVAGAPRMAVESGFFVAAQQSRTYDVSRDGTRFLLIEASSTGSQADAAGLTVVLNWSEELKRLAPRAP